MNPDREWTSPRDRLPAWGQPVEIVVLANTHDISIAKHLGESPDEGWWIDRTHGGPMLMGVPPMPAYWRPLASKSARAS